MKDAELLESIELAEKLHESNQVTPEMLDTLKTEVLGRERERLELSLYAFVQAAWHVIEPGTPFTPGWHIEAMCEHLEAVSRGEIKRLVINVPPRCSKSTTVAVFWPAWMWAKRPGLQWLCVSHSDTLATRDTRKMRMLVQSKWYQKLWTITFARDENLKGSFLNDSHGHRLAAGITSGITGRGGDILLLDDPHDRDDAVSDTKRRRCIEEYREKLSTRLNNPKTGAIVAIGQRLHEEDLFGYLIDIGFDRLTIPMRYEVDHPFATTTGFDDPRTVDGELMCPERFDEEYLAKQEVVLQSYGVAGQHQQRPAPRGGGMFKREWFEVVKAAPAKAIRVRSWDKAATDGGGAYTVGLLMSEVDGIYYIEDAVRGQVSPNGRHQLMKQTAVLDDAKHGLVTQVIEHEGGSAGKDAAMFEVRLLAGHDVRTERPTGNKKERAAPFAAQAEAGNVKLVKGDWIRAWLDEIAMFPMGKYKDQTDASSAAFTWLTQGDPGRIRGPLIASGEDPYEEQRPFSADELEELPDFLRDLVTESRAAGAEFKQFRQDDHDPDWSYMP
jgi:predicted phage terminase large subunit-like protein